MLINIHNISAKIIGDLLKILYFTSTGNSLYVAKQFKDAELLSIPQLIKNENYNIEDDIIGIIFPCYYISVPHNIKNYLEKANIKADYIFSVVTYGSSYQKTQHILNGYINIDYAGSVRMVDNYIPVFDMEDEISKKTQKDIDAEINQIIMDVNNKIKNFKSNKLKFHAYSKAADTFEKQISKNDKLSVDYDECIECQICVNICPNDNITFTDKIIIGDDCLFCLGCYHACTKYCIHALKENTKTQFRNENIELNEIIESNK